MAQQLINAYQASWTLTVTGLSTLANGATVEAPVVPSDWPDYLTTISLTSGAGAAAGGTVSILVMTSIDGTDWDSADALRTLGTLVFPAAGAQTRSIMLAVGGNEPLAPFWKLVFVNSTGAALTAAAVRACGISRQTSAFTAPSAAPLTGATLGMVLGGSWWDWRSDDAMEDARRTTQLANYVLLGVEFVRFDFDWPGIQPTNSTTYTWTYFDKIINAIVAAGLKPLPIFHRTPTWAQGTVTDSFGTTRNTSYPANMSQFATFCAAAVTRYKDRVKHWEVWNEPNLHGFWFPTPDVVGFANMLKAVYPAVKAVDPDCVVISGGLSSVPSDDARALVAGTHPHPEYRSEHGFMTGIYANGAGNSFDAVGIHPYSWPLMPSNFQTYNGWTMMQQTSPSVRSIMEANGDAAKKIWITEFGAPTGTGTNAVSDATLAAIVTEAHTLAASYPWCGPVVWYEYWDHGDNSTDTESNFGLVTNTYQVKPAYSAYLGLRNSLSTAANVALQQGVNSYSSAVDTQLNQAAPTTSYGSAATLQIGGELGATNKIQSLLRFDNLIGSGANQIPANATIIAAELQLTITAAGQGPSLHRMLQTWSATDTWNSRTAGISRDGVEATGNTLNLDYWQDAGVGRYSVTADVQAWASGASNFGWLIEPTREIVMTFASSDNATAASRPKLIVSYITTEATPTPVTIPVANFTTTAGDGTTSLNSGAGSMTVTFGTTATSLRGSIAGLTVGFRYRVAWTVSNTNATQGQAGFGTSVGGPQYRPTLAGVTGANSFEFTADLDTLHLTFQRASSGSSTFSDLSIVRIAQPSWRPLLPQPITPTFFTALSSGVTVNSTTGNITIAATGTLISAAGSFTTEVGKLYRLAFSVSGNTVQAIIGTSQGSTSLKTTSLTHAVGFNEYEFTATTTTTWVQFQRQTSGTAVVLNAAIQEILA